MLFLRSLYVALDMVRFWGSYPIVDRDGYTVEYSPLGLSLLSLYVTLGTVRYCGLYNFVDTLFKRLSGYHSKLELIVAGAWMIS